MKDRAGRADGLKATWWWWPPPPLLASSHSSSISAREVVFSVLAGCSSRSYLCCCVLERSYCGGCGALQVAPKCSVLTSSLVLLDLAFLSVIVSSVKQ